MGLASGCGPVSLLGDARVYHRRPGQAGQAAEAAGSGCSHKGAAARGFLPRACSRASRWITPRRMRSFGRAWTSRANWVTSGASPSLSMRWGSTLGTGATSAVAHALFEESLALWRELGDQKAVARSLSNLANVVKSQGDYARARALHAECLAIFTGTGRSGRRRLVAELAGGRRPRSG